LREARAAQLDGLAIDAVHMFAFIDTAPAQQQRWAEQALAISLGSQQPAAKRWEASIRNNLGMALHGQQRYAEALAQFEQATALRRVQGDSRNIQIARWMEAWTLRAMGRLDEALAIQLALERELDAAGQSDVYVFEELQALYKLRGDADKEAHYGQRMKAAQR
jgi:Tfp pilus assembly protein PilF